MTGKVIRVDVTYWSEVGSQAEVTSAILPWHKTVVLNGLPQPITVSADVSALTTEPITCTIEYDGQVVDKTTGQGAVSCEYVA